MGRRRARFDVFGVVKYESTGRRSTIQFAEILKSAESEGGEKHVPSVAIVEGHGFQAPHLVTVVVGNETPHPNTVEHHIAWIELFGVKPDGQVVHLGRADFAPSYADPRVSFHTPVEQFKAFCALSYCNIHGVWQSCIQV